MTPRRKRSETRPPATTPALLALVTLAQELIDAQQTTYTALARTTNYTRTHVKSLVEGRALSGAGFRALDAALGADGALLRLRERAVAERQAARYGYPLVEPISGRGPAPDLGKVLSQTQAGDFSSPRGPQEVRPTLRRDLLAFLGAGVALGTVGTAAVLTPTDRLVLLEQTSRADQGRGKVTLRVDRITFDVRLRAAKSWQSITGPVW